MTENQIAVVGAGAWGTALALTAARAGNEVRLWAREDEVVDAINARHENPKFLPGVPLDAAITATDDFADLGTPEAVLLVVPTQHVGEVARALVSYTEDCNADHHLRQGHRAKEPEIPDRDRRGRASGHPLAVLSGPSFAIDVARGLPTAITLACRDRSARRAPHRADRPARLPALSLGRSRGRRARRRGEECARDRLRHCRRQGARPERAKRR